MLGNETIRKKIEEAKKNRNKDFIFELFWDVMFRQMLLSKEGMPFLEAIISVFSERPLEEVKGKVKLLSSDLLQNRITDKNSRADVVASFDNDKYIIEMNSSHIMIRRNIFYAFKMASSGLKMGTDDYSEIYNTILINFNKNKFPQDDLCEMYTIMNSKGKTLGNFLKVFLIDMEKAFDESYNYKSEAEKIIGCFCRMYMTNSSLSMFKEAKEVMSTKEAENFVGRAKELSSDDEMIEFYDNKNFYELVHNTELKEERKKSLQEGIEEGKKAGIEEGEKQKAFEVARNLLKLNLSIEDISKATGLSLEEINNMR